MRARTRLLSSPPKTLRGDPKAAPARYPRRDFTLFFCCFKGAALKQVLKKRDGCCGEFKGQDR